MIKYMDTNLGANIIINSTPSMKLVDYITFPLSPSGLILNSLPRLLTVYYLIRVMSVTWHEEFNGY